MGSKLEELGLEKYLDATKGLHGGRGFKEFAALYTDDKTGPSEIAEKFNVTRPTIYEWGKLYDKMSAKEPK